MTIQTQIAQKTLGADVRTLRKARGLTLVADGGKHGEIRWMA